MTSTAICQPSVKDMCWRLAKLYYYRLTGLSSDMSFESANSPNRRLLMLKKILIVCLALILVPAWPRSPAAWT